MFEGLVCGLTRAVCGRKWMFVGRLSRLMFEGQNRRGATRKIHTERSDKMKAIVGLVVVAAVVLIAALFIGGELSKPAQQPADNDAEVLAEAAALVQMMEENDVEWLERLFIMADRSNQHYLTIAMPYTMMAVAGAILALGLGVVVVVFAVVLRGR